MKNTSMFCNKLWKTSVIIQICAVMNASAYVISFCSSQNKKSVVWIAVCKTTVYDLQRTELKDALVCLPLDWICQTQQRDIPQYGPHTLITDWTVEKQSQWLVWQWWWWKSKIFTVTILDVGVIFSICCQNSNTGKVKLITSALDHNGGVRHMQSRG